MPNGLMTFRCPDCRDIILIVLDPADFNENELESKIARHEAEHAELERLMLDG